MAVEKVIVGTVKFSNNWFTINDNLGREINVGTVNKKTGASENPKLKSLLEKAEAGTEVEIDIRDWQGKLYGNDPKGSGTKSFAPADKSFDAAKVSAQAAATMLGLQKEPDYAKFEALANQIHSWVLSKKSS